MSKRLQVLLPEAQYKELKKISKTQNKSVAEWVREQLEEALARESHQGFSESRFAKLLEFSQHNGPTGDIEELLSQIEKGRTD